ncbi:hypothetical protein [Streptomyces venezuelae]|uniref:hypothetical protein n=1 Tax=Streptomyces venezuelae TaxID=54571 RepID=UPI001682330D|nr:hypothetical protein [Streptomyces venezuelae]
MYLIHTALRAPSADDRLPSHIAELVRALVHPDSPVEHVFAHLRAEPDPVLGVYLLAGSLGEAERRTEALCRRALDVLPALRGWTATRARAPLVAPYYERLLTAASGLDGRNRPGPIPSSRMPFHPR